MTLLESTPYTGIEFRKPLMINFFPLHSGPDKLEFDRKYAKEQGGIW